MKIGISGSRNGITKTAEGILTTFLANSKISEIHHGDCVGTDQTFHNICLSFGMNIVIHPPSNPVMRAFCEGGKVLPMKHFLERNRDIVDSVDFLIALPRSGTWSTIRYARHCQKPVFIIFPDGSSA